MSICDCLHKIFTITKKAILLILIILNAQKASSQEMNFEKLFKEAQADGKCSVKKVKTRLSTVFIPNNPQEPNARFHILGWGNGTGMSVSSYSDVLQSIASHCILVVAANTQTAGTGEQLEESLLEAINVYKQIIPPKVKICMSGHSQGGGGAFNAANRMNASCVISIEADTLYTSNIRNPLKHNVEVIALWGSHDAIAPAFPTNLSNVEQVSSILTSVELFKVNHFSITSKRGANIGTLFRMAAKSQLALDEKEAKKWRKVFWGNETSSTVDSVFDGISDVYRNRGAKEILP